MANKNQYQQEQLDCFFDHSNKENPRVKTQGTDRYPSEQNK